jgi:prephenate dehydrogenase
MTEAELHHSVRGQEGAPRMSVGIIGHGHFGAFFETLMKRFYPETPVRIFSPERTPDTKRFFPLTEAVASDVVLLSMPIGATESALKDIVPLLRPETVLVDIATVKMHTQALLEKYAPGQPHISAHPMFGPEGYAKRDGNVQGLRIVVTGHNLPQQKYIEIRTSLQALGFEIVEMTAEQHDKHVAETLFLTHFIGQAIARAEFDRTAIDTPSFGFLMDAVDSVKNDTKLFKDVFTYNPYCRETLARFGKSVEDVVERILGESLKESA